MKNVTGLQRFLILLELRFTLWPRSALRSKSSLILAILATVATLAWSLVFGVLCHKLVALESGDSARTLLTNMCMLAFLLQVSFGLTAAATSEFFDVSRLLHMPLRHREVFGAMLVSGLLVPSVLVFAAPVVGGSMGLDGLSPGSFLLRMSGTGLLLALGHAAALCVSFFLMRMLSRRRMRDLGTLLASAIGVGSYILIRGFSESAGAVPQRGGLCRVSRALPSGGGVALLEGAVGEKTRALAYFGIAITLLVRLGSRLVERALMSENQTPQDQSVDDGLEQSRVTLVTPDQAMAATARSLFWREPQVKALYLQQTAFILAPAFFMILQGSPSSPILRMMVPTLALTIPITHAALLWSLFGLDGRGLHLLLLSGIPHREMLRARLVILMRVFAVIDLALITVLLSAAGLRSGNLAAGLMLVPPLFLATVLLTAVVAGVGCLMSVLSPMRLAGSGRRPIQSQRSDAMGMIPALMRMLFLIPVLILAAVVGGLVLWPLQGLLLAKIPGDFPHPLPVISPHWAWATITAAILLVWLWVQFCLRMASELLQDREMRVLDALADAGD